jgi:CBS domain-containing protein
MGMVSDRRLLAWFAAYADGTPSLSQFVSNSLNHLSLPSLNLYSSVVAAKSSDTVLDAMKLMSDQGVSSIAVIDEIRGTLLSAVSVTDIGKVMRVPEMEFNGAQPSAF